MTHHDCDCLLWRLPVANFGQLKVVVTHLCTFDHCFCMAEPGRTWEVVIVGSRSHIGGVFWGDWRVICCSTCIGIVFRSLFIETSIFLTSPSKIRESTTPIILRQLIFRYEDSVCNPQILVPLESQDSQLSQCDISLGGPAVWFVKLKLSTLRL